MTRKTYRELANEIGRLVAIEADSGDRVTWEIIDAVCNAMKSDNRAFDKDRFIEAVETAKQDTQTKWSAR